MPKYLKTIKTLTSKFRVKFNEFIINKCSVTILVVKVVKLMSLKVDKNHFFVKILIHTLFIRNCSKNV